MDTCSPGPCPTHSGQDTCPLGILRARWPWRDLRATSSDSPPLTPIRKEETEKAKEEK